MNALLRNVISRLTNGSKQTTTSADSGASGTRNVYMEYGEEMLEYCGCELPIKVLYEPRSGFKEPHCTKCMRVVHPRSKAINKQIDKLGFIECEDNTLRAKINEIIELLKANGDMETRRQT
jgi:hypothetical protein